MGTHFPRTRAPARGRKSVENTYKSAFTDGIPYPIHFIGLLLHPWSSPVKGDVGRFYTVALGPGGIGL